MFPNEVAFKLSQNAEDVENHLAGCHSYINDSAFDCSLAHSPYLQLFDNINHEPQ